MPRDWGPGLCSLRLPYTFVTLLIASQEPAGLMKGFSTMRAYEHQFRTSGQGRPLTSVNIAFGTRGLSVK